MGLKDSNPQYITRCNMLYFRNNRFAPPLMLCINIFFVHYLYTKNGFTYGHSVQYKMILVRLHVYRSIKTYKLFENTDADLSWLVF